MSNININLSEPRYDQDTFWGRFQHFFETTNPINLLASSKTLENSRMLVTKHKNKEPLPPGTTEEDLWKAKRIYDSAFHPDTGEKMLLIGRMSAQVPMNTLITAGLIIWYKSFYEILFWQWINQSFNASVNYTNRSGDAKFTIPQMLTSYVCATSGAVGTAVGLNRMVKHLPPLIGNWVPFVAVAAANCINIPMMRIREIQYGTPIFDENNNRLGVSSTAAKLGISQVVFSRVCMAVPGMLLTPVIMQYLEKKGVIKKYPWSNLPIQMGIIAFFLTFATPLACACFRQKARLSFSSLESEVQDKIRKERGTKVPDYVYYNKGL